MRKIIISAAAAVALLAGSPALAASAHHGGYCARLCAGKPVHRHHRRIICSCPFIPGGAS